MDQVRFSQLISQKLLPEDFEKIESIALDYPYFTSAQLLYAKVLQEKKDARFEKQLRKTASKIIDRKVLHNLLFPVDDEAENTGTQPLLKEEKEQVGKRDLLEEQVLTAAINSSILQEVSEEIIPDDYESLIVKKTNQKEEIETVLVEDPIHNFEEEEHSFGDWLSFYAEPALEKEKVLWERIDSIPKESNTESGLMRKAEFYSPAKMAKLSVQEDDDLVTETLAQVYHDQGHLEKAIKAYQKLQLKYPEKKIYFAGRIKEIEIQLNTQ